MSWVVLFFVLWACQLALSAGVAIAVPNRTDIPPRAQVARRLAISRGFIPCMGLMLCRQVIWLLVYRSHARACRVPAEAR